jgi:hypothetical protein
MNHETPPLSSYRLGNQMVQEQEEVLDYQSKIVSLRRTLLMMLCALLIMGGMQMVHSSIDLTGCAPTAQATRLAF